jgi:membrane protein implicated in regulation of membrane protease activity
MKNCLILILALIAAITSAYGPKWFFWVSAISAFMAGYILGGNLEGAPNKWLPGLVIGVILSLLSIWTSYWMKFYRRKSREKLRRLWQRLRNTLFKDDNGRGS